MDLMLGTRKLAKAPAEEDQLDKLHRPKEALIHQLHQNLLNLPPQGMDSGTFHHRGVDVEEVVRQWVKWEEEALIDLEMVLRNPEALMVHLELLNLICKN